MAEDGVEPLPRGGRFREAVPDLDFETSELVLDVCAGDVDLEPVLEGALLQHLNLGGPHGLGFVPNKVHPLVLFFLRVENILKLEFEFIWNSYPRVTKRNRDGYTRHHRLPVLEGALHLVEVDLLALALEAYLCDHVNDRGGHHVDRVPGLVGADEDVGVLVVVHVEATGDGPAEGSQRWAQIPGKYYLNKIFLNLKIKKKRLDP